MENWELDFHWLRIRHFVKDTFQTSNLPDLETILFLIGVQGLNRIQTRFTKEEKMELIHIGTCHILQEEGYFSPGGTDDRGWPTWKPEKEIDLDERAREEKLKQGIITYFKPLLENQTPDAM